MKYRCKVSIPGCREGYHVGETLQIGDIVFDVAHYPQIFEPVEEEKPKRVAQAAFWDGEIWDLSVVLYPSKQEATDKLMGDGVTRVIWPARFSEEGFLILPEDK